MDASFHIRPFAFERVFAVAASVDQGLRYEELQARLAVLDAETACTRADRDALLAQARAEAFEAGFAQARAERETALLAAIDALQASLEAVDTQIADIAVRVTADATEIALAAADHLAARALAAKPGAAIDEAIGRVLAQVARGTELQVRVHPEFVEEIQRLVGERQTKDRRQLSLQIIADETLAEGDARIGWDGGSLALDAAARAQAIRDELAMFLPDRRGGDTFLELDDVS